MAFVKQWNIPMGKFACIIHPLDLALATTYEPGLRGKTPALVKRALEWAEPFKVSEISGLQSAAGDEIVGELILCTLLPEQILGLTEGFVMRRIAQACYIAEKNGANIVGLEAYTAIRGKKGAEIAKRIGIPLTTGSNFTVATAIKATDRICDLVGLNLAECTAAVIGATGTLGRLLSILIARRVAQIHLVARAEAPLFKLSNEIRSLNGVVTVKCGSLAAPAIRESDVIVTATNTPSALVSSEDLKPGAIVCDLSRPRNVSSDVYVRRKDVLVLDGGVIQTPGSVNFHFYFGLPVGLVYACMAETMMLALENRYESYSVGGNVTLEKVEEIGRLAKKHGFHLAEPRSFDRPIRQDHLDRIAIAIKKRRPSAIRR
jgi:predicted amino acid dehydrogenase